MSIIFMSSLTARIHSELLRPIQVLTNQCRCAKQYYRRRPSNPGVDKRLEIFKKELPELDKRKYNEKNFDDLEEDFYDAARTSRAKYEREINVISKKIQLKQVERIHFSNQKWPNMLLWAEKEQIRNLAQSDPDLWTCEKLSQSFPVTPDAVQKLLKSQWKPVSPARIQNHDKSVAANWKAFEMGKFNFPESFVRHLKSFTSKKNIIEKSGAGFTENVKPKLDTNGEFSEIIRSYKVKTSDLKDNNCSSYKKSYNVKKLAHDNSKVIDEIDRKSEPITDALAVSTSRRNRKIGVINERDFIVTQEQPRVQEIEISSDEFSRRKISNGDDVAMKINISKDLWRKGCLYRVNNCYYTDDGEFLYRV